MKTALDLHLAASRSAVSSLDLPNRHAVYKFCHSQFDEAQGDPRDFDYFEQAFNGLRAQYLALRQQKPTSVAQEEVKAEAEKRRALEAARLAKTQPSNAS